MDGVVLLAVMTLLVLTTISCTQVPMWQKDFFTVYNITGGDADVTDEHYITSTTYDGSGNMYFTLVLPQPINTDKGSITADSATFGVIGKLNSEGITEWTQVLHATQGQGPAFGIGRIKVLDDKLVCVLAHADYHNEVCYSNYCAVKDAPITNPGFSGILACYSLTGQVKFTDIFGISGGNLRMAGMEYNYISETLYVAFSILPEEGRQPSVTYRNGENIGLVASDVAYETPFFVPYDVNSNTATFVRRTPIVYFTTGGITLYGMHFNPSYEEVYIYTSVAQSNNYMLSQIAGDTVSNLKALSFFPHSLTSEGSSIYFLGQGGNVNTDSCVFNTDYYNLVIYKFDRNFNNYDCQTYIETEILLDNDSIRDKLARNTIVGKNGMLFIASTYFSPPYSASFYAAYNSSTFNKSFHFQGAPSQKHSISLLDVDNDSTVYVAGLEENVDLELFGEVTEKISTACFYLAKLSVPSLFSSSFQDAAPSTSFVDVTLFPTIESSSRYSAEISSFAIGTSSLADLTNTQSLFISSNDETTSVASSEAQVEHTSSPVESAVGPTPTVQEESPLPSHSPLDTSARLIESSLNIFSSELSLGQSSEGDAIHTSSKEVSVPEQSSPEISDTFSLSSQEPPTPAESLSIAHSDITPEPEESGVVNQSSDQQHVPSPVDSLPVTQSIFAPEISVTEPELTLEGIDVSSYDTCSYVDFTALLSRAASVEYHWRLERVQDGALQSTITTSTPTVLIDLSSAIAGNYRMSVQIPTDDRILSAAVVVRRKDYAFGHKCQQTIAIAPTFGLLETNEGRQIVDRMNRLVIRTSSIPNHTYLWSITDGSSRRSAMASCTSSLCSLVTTSLTASDGIVIQPSSAGIAGSTQFTISLAIRDPSQKIVYYRDFPLQTSYEAATPLAANSPGFFISSNIQHTPTTLKRRLNGIPLVTDFNMTAIIGSTGWQLREREVVTFIYSYWNANTKDYVPLATTTDGKLVTKLPAGYGPNNELTIQLRVLNNWGVSAFTTQVIRVGSPTSSANVAALTSLAQEGLRANTTETFISSAVTIATYVNQNAKKFTSSDKEQISKVIDELLDFTSDLISNTDLENANETTIQQQITVIDVLTQTPEVLSANTKIRALDLVSSVFSVARRDNTTITTRSLTQSTFQQVAKVISNIVGGGLSDSQVASKTIVTANDLAKTILSDKLSTEQATTLVTNNFEMIVQKNKAQSLSNSRIETRNNQTGTTNVVHIPQSFAYDIIDSEDETVSYTVLIFTSNPFASSGPKKQADTASSIMDVTFNYENGSVISVKNLTQPLVMQITKPKKCHLIGEKATFECRYWNEELALWKSDGCYWVPEETTDTNVGCHCNHTTSFSAFLLTRGKCPEKTPGLDISGIVFNTIYIVLCVPILIGLFITRNTQPVKSRYIAPFVGILAILVDAVMNGWAKNALRLGELWTASDYFAYAVMVVSNPLSAVAMFVFLWQQVRFILFQNLYYLMSVEDSAMKNKMMKISRLLTSKLVFVLSSTAVGISVCAYFAIMVIIAATRTTGTGTDRIVTAQVISYMLIVIALGIAIIVALICDIVLSFKRTRRSIDIQSDTEIMAVQQTKGFSVLIKNMKNDALAFRKEACFIVLAVFVMFLLYATGIASVYREAPSLSGIKVTSQTIEFIYMFAAIVAFGGYVCFEGIRSYIAKKRTDFSFNPEDHEQANNPQDEFLLTMLQDSAGYSMFHAYCTLEFSLENLLLWRELEELRTSNLIMSPFERKQSLERIDFMYIRNNSERELNLSNAARQVFKKIAELEQPSVAEAEEAFCKLYGVCMTNLGDTFTRLSTTDLYKMYKETRVTQQELQVTFT